MSETSTPIENDPQLQAVKRRAWVDAVKTFCKEKGLTLAEDTKELHIRK